MKQSDKTPFFEKEGGFVFGWMIRGRVCLAEVYVEITLEGSRP